jgi:class 3 adenylate cyclase
MLLSDPKKSNQNSKEALPYLSQISSSIWTNLERTNEQNLRIKTEKKFSSLVRQLDPSLYEFITNNMNRIDDPEKMISSTRGILFFDQKAYTTMTEDFDDATIGKFARIVGEWVTNSAARYGARVSNFAGDAFLLETFCIGSETEKSIALRTLSLVWNLAQTMGELNQILLKEGFSPVTFRFGAHIGNVAAANLDFIQKGLSSSVGDTVNITARLQSLAKAGTIYISGDLAQYALEDFVITPIPKQYVKGRLKRIDIFSLVGKMNASLLSGEDEAA